MDHSRSHDPSLDDPLAVPDTTAEAVGPPTGSGTTDDVHGARRHGVGGTHGLDHASLERIVVTQPVIEQAKGMLMGFYGIGEDQAFALLSRWSSERRVKVRDLSRLLVDAAAVPDRQPFGALRRLLAKAPPG